MFQIYQQQTSSNRHIFQLAMGARLFYSHTNSVKSVNAIKKEAQRYIQDDDNSYNMVLTKR